MINKKSGGNKVEKVSIVKCNSYDYELVERNVFECLDSLGYIKNKLNKGDKVLIKTNLLKKNSPFDAVTTHPTVVESLVRYFQVGFELLSVIK